MLHGAHVKEMTMKSTVAFMKARKSKGEKTCQLKTNHMMMKIHLFHIFLLLFLDFSLTTKLIKCVMEQQS